MHLLGQQAMKRYELVIPVAAAAAVHCGVSSSRPAELSYGQQGEGQGSEVFQVCLCMAYDISCV
jgi:hypothetical protein